MPQELRSNGEAKPEDQEGQSRKAARQREGPQVEAKGNPHLRGVALPVRAVEASRAPDWGAPRDTRSGPVAIVLRLRRVAAPAVPKLCITGAACRIR